MNEYLLRVIGNVWADPINHPAKVVVSTLNNVPFCDILFEFLKDFL